MFCIKHFTFGCHNAKHFLNPYVAKNTLLLFKINWSTGFEMINLFRDISIRKTICNYRLDILIVSEVKVMEVRENIMVPLGYGKFVRSDKIISLEPIEDDRGPGRRTIVHVEEVGSPLIASRTENSILGNMVESPREELEAAAALELLKDVQDDIMQIGPMLRKSIKKEAQFDLSKIERKIDEILNHEIGRDDNH